MAGKTVTVGEVASEVEKDIPFFQSSGGGLTLSGGEPARQAQFSYNLLLACQEKGIHTALETTDYARWDVMSDLASVTDLFLYDVKLIDSSDHRRHTGVPNGPILDNLRKLATLDNEIHVRVPYIPGVNDSEDQIRAIARFVAPLAAGAPLDLRLSASGLQGDAGTQRMVGLINAFVGMGGNMLTLTVTDVEELKRAMAEPEKYRHLRVRMGGWSAYFVMLGEEQQRLHISRVEHGLV
jgi:organic radical activating enzyme